MNENVTRLALTLGPASERRQDLPPADRELIERAICVFHAKVDTDSTPRWTVIPRQAGHLFQGKLDT